MDRSLGSQIVQVQIVRSGQRLPVMVTVVVTVVAIAAMSLGVRRLADLIVLVPAALSAVLVLRIAVVSREVRRLEDLIALVPVGLIVALRLAAVGLLAAVVVLARRLRERTMPAPIVDQMVGLARLVGMRRIRTPIPVPGALGLVVRDRLGVKVGELSGVLGCHARSRPLPGVTNGQVEIVIARLRLNVLVRPNLRGAPVARPNCLERAR